MKRTVLRSSGTVVPPEVTHTIRRVDGCAATKAASRSEAVSDIFSNADYLMNT